MPKETNLNVAPYFDDFTPDSNYYKVLYKPGFPVQARELTTMQSILQDQIENMGNHFFKEGAKVIPGSTTFEDDFLGVQIESEFLGLPVSLYLDQLIGKKIKGASSGVTAQVVTYITDEESDRGNFTLYVTYRNSGFDEDNLAVAFNDVDFCLRLKEAGYRNLYTPFAELYHHESVTRGPDTDPVKATRFEKEALYMKKRWASEIENDIYYNPNLSLKEGYSIELERGKRWPWSVLQ